MSKTSCMQFSVNAIDIRNKLCGIQCQGYRMMLKTSCALFTCHSRGIGIIESMCKLYIEFSKLYKNSSLTMINESPRLVTLQRNNNMSSLLPNAKSSNSPKVIRQYSVGGTLIAI